MITNNDHTAETSGNDNSLVDELINRMNDLEEKFRTKFNENPMPQTLYEIITDITNDDPSSIEPLKLCAIFSDFAESFLDRAVDYDKILKQNSKLNNELHKANDLIRRLTDENEYHLNKLKFLAKQLEIYKDSWRGKLTEKSVERQISELVNDRDKELEELRSKLSITEKEFMKYKFENRNLNSTHSNYGGNDDSKIFSELKEYNVARSSIPQSIQLDKLYDEINEMDHRQLVEHCIELRQKQDHERNKIREKQRPQSAVRNSQHCCTYKSLTQAEK